MKPDLDFTIAFNCEQIPGKGEDSFLLDLQLDDEIFIGVFDGCGGSGARIYQEFDGKTGAYIASRTAAEQTSQWLHNKERRQKVSLESELKSALQQCNEKVKTANVLQGSMVKDFPTTAAAMCVRSMPKQAQALHAELYFAGDSRCFALLPTGLVQLSADDLVVQDAFQNLYDAAPMTNVLSAAQDCRLHKRTIKCKIPCVLFAATDGCYDYLRSPMEFEELLLHTMRDSKTAEEWKEQLSFRIGAVAGDDYTLVMAAFGFGSFDNMKKRFEKRLQTLLRKYNTQEEDPEALRTQWEIYRKHYEQF